MNHINLMTSAKFCTSYFCLSCKLCVSSSLIGTSIVSESFVTFIPGYHKTVCELLPDEKEALWILDKKTYIPVICTDCYRKATGRGKRVMDTDEVVETCGECETCLLQPLIRVKGCTGPPKIEVPQTSVQKSVDKLKRMSRALFFSSNDGRIRLP